MPKVCPAQQGDTAACTPVKKHVSQLLTSHSVWNLEHNFCKYCRAYTKTNFNWAEDSTDRHPCRCSESNFAERPQLSISGDSLELSAYLARSRLGLISIRCLPVRTATISDPPNCTCTLALYLMPLTISWQLYYFWSFSTNPPYIKSAQLHMYTQGTFDTTNYFWLFLITSDYLWHVTITFTLYL